MPSRLPPSGANDQTFRLVVKPGLWGREMRLRLTNVFGTKPVTFDGVHVGLQLGGPALVKGTNRPVSFTGKDSVTLQPGTSVWSDPVTLPFVRDASAADLTGRKLAVSFHVAGESGPMTWHAKALQTSYVSPPGSGSKGAAEDEAAFPYSTASWFFLDAIEMLAPANSFAVVAFGDSITDGTASTMNGDDRWPDVLARRLQAIYGNRVAVVNAGIGGNQVAGPAEYGPQKPYPGGPSAQSRIERDVIDLSGVSAMIWLEGINDFSRNGNAAVETVIGGMKDVVGRIRAKRPDLRVFGATVLDRARLVERGPRLHRAGPEAAGAQRLHPQRRPVRRGGRLRSGHLRPAFRRSQAGIRAGEHHRRTGRQAASQSRRLSRHGDGDRPRPAQAQAVMISSLVMAGLDPAIPIIGTAVPFYRDRRATPAMT